MIREEPVDLTTQDGARIRAMLHYDDATPARTALTIMHPTTDWRRHYILRRLAERGCGALGCTTRYTGREADLILEDTILDLAAAVEFLRSRGVPISWRGRKKNKRRWQTVFCNGSEKGICCRFADRKPHPS